jgi:pimeloyl-ACP methyl ester carboxylesterase
MPEQLPRLILFPGLGVSEHLFAFQKTLPARLEFPLLPTPDESESLQHYAARVAASIDPTPPLYLGGVSFGAMIALEMARILNPRGIFVISGALNQHQISPVIRILAALASGTPEVLFPFGRRIVPAFLRILGRFDRHEREHLVDTFATVNFHLARWGATRIMQWSAPADIPCPIHWIHGQIDHVVPLWRVRPDAVVLGAGHFLNVSHPEATNEFIASHLSD